MPLRLPPGQKIAVSLGVDFDAHSVWPGSFNMKTPGVLSRGEFGAEVGAPRLLKLFEKYQIKTTWFTPTHTMETFPAAFKAVMDRGHEIGAHGCLHEGIGSLEESVERALLERQVALHLKIVGRKPRGYRSPSWDFSNHTLALLDEFKFDWDSSLMGRDFEPYRPRQVTLRDQGGSVFGAPSRVLEIPVSWALDDWPAFEYVPRANAGLSSNEVVYQRWKDHFDYAYREFDAGVLTIAVHPQSIGRAPNIMMLERFIAYLKSHPGVWFAPLSDIADCWRD
jgi:peptidoglycan-N-acetylglucosamine deacetylase